MRKHFRKYRNIRKKRSFFGVLFKSRFFWVFLAVLGIGGFSVYGAAFSQIFQIEEIRIEGISQEMQKELKISLEEFMPSRILFWETKNLLLVNGEKLRMKILEAFPEIESITLHKDFPGVLAANVKERERVATWCSSDSTCFDMDMEGVLFREGSSSDPITLYDEEKETGAPGEKVVEKSSLLALFRFQDLLETQEANLRLGSGNILSSTRWNLRTSEQWDIYMNPQEGVDWQLTKLQTVLEKQISLQKRKNLAYIDLRFGDQAYVKYQK